MISSDYLFKWSSFFYIKEFTLKFILNFFWDLIILSKSFKEKYTKFYAKDYFG